MLKPDHTESPTSEPPRPVLLRGTGEVEIVKPVTLTVRAFRRSQQPLWFRRFLAVGSGALLFFGLVLVSAILIGISDSASGPDVAANEKLDAAQTRELFSFDLSIPLTFLPPTGEVAVRANTMRRPARPRFRATNKSRLRSRLRPDEPKFIPTTLVIYAQNGVVNTRVEPWGSNDR